MKYLFNISGAYEVEANSAEEAQQLLQDNPNKYFANWQEITLVDESDDD